MSSTNVRFVAAPNLPPPVGPYSPAVVFDRLVFVSGQGAVDPATGRMAGPDVTAQTEQVFRNVQAILEAAGTDLSHVLRCGVFLVDMADFPAMNSVWDEWVVRDHTPPRATVQAALAKPAWKIEIVVTAAV